MSGKPAPILLVVICVAAVQTPSIAQVDASVQSESLSVRGTEGPMRIGGWRLSGDSVIAEERVLRSLPGRGVVFSRTSVDRAALAVLTTHENNGYPFCVVTPLALIREGGLVYPSLKVEAGPKVVLGFIEFAGKPGTKRELLERVAGFSPRAYSRPVVRQWRQALEQSGLVQIDTEEIVSRDSAYGLRFWVTSQRNNRASGVAGYSPADRKVTGLVNVSFLNLFDTRRRLEAGWQSAFSRTSYSLSYTEPWVFRTGVDLTGCVRVETVDTTYSQVNLSVAADARAATWTRVGLATGFDRFTDARQRTSASVTWAGTGVTVDSRDFPPNPRTGLRLAVMTRVGSRSTDSSRAAAITHVEVDVAGIAAIGRTLAWSNSVSARAAYSVAGLTEPELYRMGGPGTVRGYNEGEFASTSLGWFSTELRYLLGRGSRVYPFLDAGTYRDAAGWHATPGYGAGARVATRAGVLGLDYGVAFRDSPVRGKVHLSFDAAF